MLHCTSKALLHAVPHYFTFAEASKVLFTVCKKAPVLGKVLMSSVKRSILRYTSFGNKWRGVPHDLP